MQIAGVEIKHPDKILFPADGITKFDLVQYYYMHQDRILPELKGRPISMVRAPGGIGEGKFYQKHPGESFPAYIERINIQEKTETDVYILIDEAADLVYLANLGVIEFHTWGSTYPDIERPDRIIFDLDPNPGVAWSAVQDAALELREILSEQGGNPTVKTSGGKGLHIIIAPAAGLTTWKAVKEFAKDVAEKMATKHPQILTTEMHKADRGQRIFIDYLRNDRGATAVAAYSVRARAGAPVSFPFPWDQLADVKSGDHWKLPELIKTERIL